MTVATACRVDKRKFAVFFLLNVIRGHLWLGHVEKKEFAWQSIGYCFTDLVTDSLTCV